MKFKEKVALVTGGSRGIGRAIVELLAEQGANVAFNYRTNEQAAAEVAAVVEGQGRRVKVICADVSKADEVDGLVEETMDTFGRIDILINNAGITRDMLILRMSERDWDEVIETNLKSAYLCSKSVLRAMIRQRYGRIVNLSSVSGIAGNAGQANYAASKAGIIGLTRSLAREVSSRGITVNAVAPGYIATEIWQTVNSDIRGRVVDLIPLGRAGTAREVAEAVVFLASDSAAYITGQVLNVDGGMVMA